MAQGLVGLGGFLAAVFWVNLMFDLQVLDHAATVPPEVLASIAGYYRHVTVTADPMGSVISLVMMLMVLGAVVQLSRGRVPVWLSAGVLLTAAVPVLYSLLFLIPSAERLAAGTGTLEADSELARALLRGHMVCLVLILLYLVLQMLAVQRLRRLPSPP